MWMWPVQGFRSEGDSSAQHPSALENGVQLPLPQLCVGTQFPSSPTAPLHTGPVAMLLGALVTKTSLLGKGEGLSVCLSAFLNPGQVLCFSRAPSLVFLSVLEGDRSSDAQR